MLVEWFKTLYSPFRPKIWSTGGSNSHLGGFWTVWNRSDHCAWALANNLPSKFHSVCTSKRRRKIAWRRIVLMQRHEPKNLSKNHAEIIFFLKQTYFFQRWVPIGAKTSIYFAKRTDRLKIASQSGASGFLCPGTKFIGLIGAAAGLFKHAGPALRKAHVPLLTHKTAGLKKKRRL